MFGIFYFWKVWLVWGIVCFCVGCEVFSLGLWLVWYWNMFELVWSCVDVVGRGCVCVGWLGGLGCCSFCVGWSCIWGVVCVVLVCSGCGWFWLGLRWLWLCGLVYCCWLVFGLGRVGFWVLCCCWCVWIVLCVLCFWLCGVCWVLWFGKCWVCWFWLCLLLLCGRLVYVVGFCWIVCCGGVLLVVWSCLGCLGVGGLGRIWWLLLWLDW